MVEAGSPSPEQAVGTLAPETPDRISEESHTPCSLSVAQPGMRYLEDFLGEAGQVEAVEQLLICQGAAVSPHLIRTHDGSLPLEHKVAVTGPDQLRCALLGGEECQC